VRRTRRDLQDLVVERSPKMGKMMRKATAVVGIGERGQEEDKGTRWE
jgi:hypothetical protein